MKELLFRKKRMIFYSILFGLFMCLVKSFIYYLNLEIFSPTQAGFFTSIFTGVILILGFLMAGVLSDYKESEKIPSEMHKSIYVISRESVVIHKTKCSLPAINLYNKLIAFIELFRTKFIYKNTEEILALLDSFSDNFAEMDSEVESAIMIRLRNEQANLRYLLNRIITIRDTLFSESGYVLMYSVVILYLIALSLLKIEHFWKGIFFVFVYSSILYSVVSLIKDMDDPFEYYTNKKSSGDEIDFSILYTFKEELSNNSVNLSKIKI